MEAAGTPLQTVKFPIIGCLILQGSLANGKAVLQREWICGRTKARGILPGRVKRIEQLKTCHDSLDLLLPGIWDRKFSDSEKLLVMFYSLPGLFSWVPFNLHFPRTLYLFIIHLLSCLFHSPEHALTSPCPAPFTAVICEPWESSNSVYKSGLEASLRVGFLVQEFTR